MDTIERLKLIRQLSGLTQEKLAARLGVSFATLNSWINGRSKPRAKAQANIDELLRLMTGAEKIPKEALEAKKRAIADRARSHTHVVDLILNSPDILDEFVLALTYHSNRIEGSRLTEPETAAILFENAALPDKSIVEQMEVKNHQAALNVVFRHAREKRSIGEPFILNLHSILLNGIRDDAGRYRNHAVRIVGSNVPTANPLKVPVLMRDVVANIRTRARDAVRTAALVHSRFEQIHPFSDGNGRVGRLLLSAMLLRKNLPPAVIRQENRRFYLLHLNKAQLENDISPLEDLICDSILDGFKIIREDRI